jgi:hypothetical protein
VHPQPHHHAYQASGGLSVGPLVIAIILVILAVGILMIAATWRLFSKAEQRGWAAIIPFYNTIVLLRIAGKPWWWLLLTVIPFVNVVIAVIVFLDLAKSFGKGTGFGIQTFFFPVICIPILGFGAARYVGPGGQPPYQGRPHPPQGPPYLDESSTVRFPSH